MSEQTQFKAILFDFFDVIYADAFKRWLADRGIQPEGAILQANMDMDSGKIDVEEFYARIADATGTAVKQFRSDLDGYHILNEEILPLLKSLGQNYQLGLLSSAESNFLRNLLREHRLEPLFHHVCISSELGMIKPKREIFDHILGKMELNPEDAIFIDDNEKNVRAAEKLGLTGIIYADTPTLYRDLDAHGIIT